jgi:hypothetical protein
VSLAFSTTYLFSTRLHISTPPSPPTYSTHSKELIMELSGLVIS